METVQVQEPIQDSSVTTTLDTDKIRDDLIRVLQEQLEEGGGSNKIQAAKELAALLNVKDNLMGKEESEAMPLFFDWFEWRQYQRDKGAPNGTV